MLARNSLLTRAPAWAVARSSTSWVRASTIALNARPTSSNSSPVLIATRALPSPAAKRPVAAASAPRGFTNSRWATAWMPSPIARKSMAIRAISVARLRRLAEEVFEHLEQTLRRALRDPVLRFSKEIVARGREQQRGGHHRAEDEQGDSGSERPGARDHGGRRTPRPSRTAPAARNVSGR